MRDKGQIRDLMRNCSEKQYELLERFGINDISFYSFNKTRVGVRYEDALTAELIFLSEEEEKALLLDGKGICFWSTPELGEYYLNKHSFLYKKKVEYTLCETQGIYNQKGKLIFYWYDE